MKELPDWLVTSNDIAALSLALTVNATLLYLIQSRTPTFLRPYAQILRIHCVTDVCCDVVLFLIGSQVYPFNNRLYYVCKGIWRAKTEGELMLQLNIMIGTVAYFPMFMIPIDFVFRWLLICHGYRMSNRQLAAYTLAAFGCSSFVGFPYIRMIMRTDSKLFVRGEVEYYKKMLETNVIPLLGIINSSEFRTIFMIFLLNSAFCLEYMFIGYMVRRITQKTAERSWNAQPDSVLATNRQITRVLVLQALVPLLVVAPSSLTILFSMLGIDSPMLGAVALLMLAWLAVLRPVATILIIPHYRSGIIKQLRGEKHKVSAQRIIYNNLLHAAPAQWKK